MYMTGSKRRTRPLSHLARMVDDSRMSSVGDWPEAGYATAESGAGIGHGAGFGQGPGFPPLVEPEGQFGPLAEPLAGWMCLAECASDLAPGIGDVMRSAGLLI